MTSQKNSHDFPKKFQSANNLHSIFWHNITRIMPLRANQHTADPEYSAQRPNAPPQRVIACNTSDMESNQEITAQILGILAPKFDYNNIEIILAVQKSHPNNYYRNRN